MKNDLPFQLLSRFSRALSHELRTPLSVVSNELYVLGANGAEVDAAKEKVKQIDQMLTQVQGFLRSPKEFSELSLKELFEECSDVEVEGKLDGNLRGDKELLVLSVKSLIEISSSLGMLSSKRVALGDDCFALELLVSEGVMREELLLSECLSPSGNLDAALLPLIDAIFHFHEITLKKDEKGRVLFQQKEL